MPVALTDSDEILQVANSHACIRKTRKIRFSAVKISITVKVLVSVDQNVVHMIEISKLQSERPNYSAPR
jgi:hypothetical protein